MANKFLYKYQAGTSEQVESILAKKLYFSSKNGLNDPMDCMPEIDWAERRKFFEVGKYCFQLSCHGLDSDAREVLSDVRVINSLYETYANPKNFGVFLNEHSDSIGLLSLSDTPENQLMWSHYANGHRGYCVGIEFEYEESQMLFPSSDFRDCNGRLLKIEYTDEPIALVESFFALIKIFVDRNAKMKGRKLTTDEVIEVLSFKNFGAVFFEHFAAIYYSRKLPLWSYEQEYRFISYPNKTVGTGLKSLKNASSILEITFGCRCSNELRNKLMEGFRGQKVKFYTASISDIDRQRVCRERIK